MQQCKDEDLVLFPLIFWTLLKHLNFNCSRDQRKLVLIKRWLPKDHLRQYLMMALDQHPNHLLNLNLAVYLPMHQLYQNLA